MAGAYDRLKKLIEQEEEQKGDNQSYCESKQHEELDQRAHALGHLIVEPIGEALS